MGAKDLQSLKHTPCHTLLKSVTSMGIADGRFIFKTRKRLNSPGGTIKLPAKKKTGICVRKMPVGTVVLRTILSEMTRSIPFFIP